MRTIKGWCTISILLLLQGLSHAGANTLDSLRLLYQKASSEGGRSQAVGLYAFELSKTAPDSALALAQTGLRLSIQSGSDTGRAVCLNTKGWCYCLLGKNDSAILYLDSAAHLFHKINAATFEARSLINLSVVYNRQKHYNQAIACLLPARKILEGADDAMGKAYAELQIGVAYRQQGQFSKARDYLKSAIVSFDKLAAQTYVADALSSLGGLYIYLDKPDSSLMCYRQMLTINEGLGNANGVAFAYENTGDAFLKKYEREKAGWPLDSALKYYSAAGRIFSTVNDVADAVYEQYNTGKTLRRMKLYKPAQASLSKAFHYFDAAKSINNAYDAALELVVLFKEQQHYEEALRYTEIAQQYKDTLDTRNRSGDMAEMLARYETERKDQTIRLLNAQQLLDHQELTRGRVTLGFSGLLLVLAGVLAFVAFSRARVRRQLHDVSLRNQLARDLHDDVGSSLSSIMMLSKMGNTAGLSGIGMQQSIIDKIDFTSRDIMERMSDIVWSMNPKYDRFISLKEKIETHLAHVRDMSETDTQVLIADEIAGMKLPMDLRRNLFLIVKEAVNNALKYSAATRISIRISLLGDLLCMIISDNGIGFDTAADYSGNGMDTMIQRAKHSGGSYSIISGTGGTEITVKIPLPRIR